MAVREAGTVRISSRTALIPPFHILGADECLDPHRKVVGSSFGRSQHFAPCRDDAIHRSDAPRIQGPSIGSGGHCDVSSRIERRRARALGRTCRHRPRAQQQIAPRNATGSHGHGFRVPNGPAGSPHFGTEVETTGRWAASGLDRHVPIDVVLVLLGRDGRVHATLAYGPSVDHGPCVRIVEPFGVTHHVSREFVLGGDGSRLSRQDLREREGRPGELTSGYANDAEHWNTFPPPRAPSWSRQLRSSRSLPNAIGRGRSDACIRAGTWAMRRRITHNIGSYVVHIVAARDSPTPPSSLVCARCSAEGSRGGQRPSS